MDLDFFRQIFLSESLIGSFDLSKMSEFPALGNCAFCVGAKIFFCFCINVTKNLTNLLVLKDPNLQNFCEIISKKTVLRMMSGKFNHKI